MQKRRIQFLESQLSCLPELARSSKACGILSQPLKGTFRATHLFAVQLYVAYLHCGDVSMITSDYHHTAIAVARDVGMVRPQGQVVVIDTIRPCTVDFEHQVFSSHRHDRLWAQHPDPRTSPPDARFADPRASSASQGPSKDASHLVRVPRVAALENKRVTWAPLTEAEEPSQQLQTGALQPPGHAESSTLSEIQLPAIMKTTHASSRTLNELQTSAGSSVESKFIHSAQAVPIPFRFSWALAVPTRLDVLAGRRREYGTFRSLSCSGRRPDPMRSHRKCFSGSASAW